MNKLMRPWIASLLLFGLPFPVLAGDVDTERQYLSGHDKDDAVPWKFMCTSGAHSGYWTNLPVPSHWDVHGFGTLNYHKDLTNAWDEKGLYEREFAVPKRWSERRVFLVFEGVMTDTSASIDGQPVGPMHQGGFYRFKYDVTRLLKFGEPNRLEVTVAKHSANSSVNNAERLADYWVFGGIYRPVYLESVPTQFIDRVAIDARADGTFAMDVFTTGTSGAATVEARIRTLDGRAIGVPFGRLPAAAKTTLRTRVAAPKLWTAETPNLYEADVDLMQDGRIVHRIRQRFGFRTMEVRDGDGLYVNGRRVILKGANRHSFWPDSGRCLSDTVHRLDIETMKDANMNAVRMSHYPPDAGFLDLCDELGLYVLDELGGWHHYYDTRVGSKLVEEMVERDVNHPCILFWDNGNEGGFNTNVDHLFAEYDPQQRRVLHPWAPFSGVNTAHYLAYDTASVACEGKAMFYHSGKESEDTADSNRYIYMPTEFQHGLYDGGAGAGLEDYWYLMTSSKFLGGGFIWALLDDGIKRPDTGEIDVAGNQAPDGIVGPYRQREGSFYAIKDIWSPVVIRENELGADFTGTLTIENRFNFTDVRQCRFAWQLRRFHRFDEDAAGFKVLAEGKAASPEIPPGQSGSIRLDLPGAWRTADALALRVSDPSGRELWTRVWPLPGLDLSRAEGTRTSGPAAMMVESNTTVTIRSGDLSIVIDGATGRLIGAARGLQKFSLANGPRLAGATEVEPARIDRRTDGAEPVVAATFDKGDLKSIQWRLRADGWLQCDYVYSANGPKDYFGVAFDYPESQVKRKKWLGEGPYRVWKNRLRGTTLNVWENDYNNTIAGWKDWVYPEFKGCFAGVRWLQLETTEGSLTVIVRNVPFTQVLTPDFPPVSLAGKTIPPLPQAGLAFLHGIPPIGSKFKEASASGPQGQPNMPSGDYRGSLEFYFGKLMR